MPDSDHSRKMADEIGLMGAAATEYWLLLKAEGWHVSATQMLNAVKLLRDVSRRLRTGDDCGERA